MTVLAAIDFSKNSHAALCHAAHLARAGDGKLVVAHSVVHADEDAFWRHLVQTPWEVPERIRKVAESRLRETVREVLDDDEMPADVSYVVELKSAADGILAAADAHNADLLVLGSTGAGPLKNVLLGSSAEHVVRSSEIPVLTVPPEAKGESFHKILAPVDFSDFSRKSLELAADLARQNDAELLILHAFALPAASLALLDMQAPPESVEAYEEQKWAEFDQFIEEFDLTDLDSSRLLRISTPSAAIDNVADEEGVDLICMGTAGHRGLKRVMLGSTAARVLRHPPCAVMTVP
ncbi:universal stress protein [Persicimonas caeni]|uniref:Universal stress protein n=1 Tax=Persicimonas caeni TaxID=2292766 RepID=A0A4Y6Q0A6_PERCE|nr:universal stress protein [Persicimonas caeni]QDG53677.1 universal stress protein [Persicimonas caeni]QED34898.1 universal stress protein [Persicimonas caeni]